MGGRRADPGRSRDDQGLCGCEGRISPHLLFEETARVVGGQLRADASGVRSHGGAVLSLRPDCQETGL